MRVPNRDQNCQSMIMRIGLSEECLNFLRWDAIIPRQVAQQQLAILSGCHHLGISIL
jgi:hypothetical protein